MEISSQLPIGFFDSGLGGLSVLREAVRLMPQEDYIYFGDSRNAPYGTKTLEQIRRLSLTHAEMLYRSGIKALVVACNTATSAAISILREVYTDIPVIGIEPALKPAVSIGEHPRVIVMATPLTVRGQKLHELLGRYAKSAEVTALGAAPALWSLWRTAIWTGLRSRHISARSFFRTWKSPSMPSCSDALIIRF